MRFVFSIILILSLLTGCGLEEPVSKVESGVENEQKESPKQTFGVGDVVKIGETELIIKSVSFRKGDPYVPPKKGKVLELEIEGKNNGSRSWFLSDGDFNLYDKEGRKLDQYFSIDDQSLTGEVNQGKTTKGKIFYDVAESDRYELIYKPNFLTDQEIKFNIEPSK